MIAERLDRVQPQRTTHVGSLETKRQAIAAKFNFERLSKEDLLKMGYGKSEAWWISTLHEHYMKTSNFKDMEQSYIDAGDPCGHSGGTWSFTCYSLNMLKEANITGPKRMEHNWNGVEFMPRVTATHSLTPFNIN
jgi:hypothetical protein